jgi:hypothetical protein
MDGDPLFLAAEPDQNTVEITWLSNGPEGQGPRPLSTGKPNDLRAVVRAQLTRRVVRGQAAINVPERAQCIVCTLTFAGPEGAESVSNPGGRLPVDPLNQDGAAGLQAHEVDALLLAQQNGEVPHVGSQMLPSERSPACRRRS